MLSVRCRTNDHFSLARPESGNWTGFPRREVPWEEAAHPVCMAVTCHGVHTQLTQPATPSRRTLRHTPATSGETSRINQYLQTNPFSQQVEDVNGELEKPSVEVEVLYLDL